MVRLQVFRALACTLVLFSSALAASAEPWKVTPSTGIGPILLGTDYKKYTTLLHERDSMGNVNGFGYVRFTEPIELQLYRGKVDEVLAKQSTFTIHGATVHLQTEKGLKIGDPVAAMEAAYGRNYQMRALKTAKSEPPQDYYAYLSEGLAFQTRGGLIYIIIVFPRK
jgi:hypothetical protein